MANNIVSGDTFKNNELLLACCLILYSKNSEITEYIYVSVELDKYHHLAQCYCAIAILTISENLSSHCVLQTMELHHYYSLPKLTQVAT